MASRELGPERGHLVVGEGSDGRRYYGSEVFPQDRLGEIVQLVPWAEGLYGLSSSGGLYRVGPETGGAVFESSLARGIEVSFMTLAQ